MGKIGIFYIQLQFILSEKKWGKYKYFLIIIITFILFLYDFKFLHSVNAND